MYDNGEGGYVEVPLVCGACGGDVELLEGGRPDGAKVTELRCPCLRTQMIHLDMGMGRLELGVVRDSEVTDR